MRMNDEGPRNGPMVWLMAVLVIALAAKVDTTAADIGRFIPAASIFLRLAGSFCGTVDDSPGSTDHDSKENPCFNDYSKNPLCGEQS